MEAQTNTPQQLPFKLLPLDDIEDHNPHVFPSQKVNKTDNKTVQLLKNCEFFRQKFPSSVELEEFAQLAKSSVTHETYNYGTVLLNENDDIDKFYLLIEGKVEKIRQKPPQQRNSILRSNLVRQNALPNVEFEGSPNRMRRSRLSARVEEPFLFNRKSPRMTIMKLPQIDEKTLRPSLLLKSLQTPEEIITSEKSTRVPELDQEGQELMDFVCKDNFELHRKYYYEGVLGASKVQTYNSGDFVGENLEITRSTSMLVVSSLEAHFLTFSRYHLNKILTLLENKAQEKFEIFTKIFPSFHEKLVKTFSSYFQQKYYQKNELIYSQDDNTKDIYFLCSGQVRLFKASSNQEYEIPIVAVINGQFFGEEALFDREVRQETAVANTPNTLVYVLNGDFYDMMKTSLAAFFEILIRIAQEKFTWREAKATELFEFEKNSPRALLTYSSSKRTLPSTNCSQTVEKRKFSYFYSRGSIETSPISASEISKMSEDTPNNRVTEQYKSQFSRTIFFCNNGNDVKRSSPLEDFNLKNELSVSDHTRKIYISRSKDATPRKAKDDKDHHEKEAKSAFSTKPRNSVRIVGKRKKKRYIPTFIPIKKINATDDEVDTHHIRVNSKELQLSGKKVKRNTLGKLLRMFKIR